MSQVTEQSVRFQTALASIKLIQASAVLDLTEDDFDFLTSNKVWIATDRSRARRCVEKRPPRCGGMKTYNWEGLNPDGYFLDKLEPIPSALPSFQKLFQVSATALSIP